ncbi:hypothetical protein [Loktanella sp. R86503]|uniref:hypothetical protein n=1 Tax=Loktanella sp. R86503 TaxID=3093847 RepID=UPI0036D86C41
MTAPTIQDRLRTTNASYDDAELLDEAADALDAAQARIAALEMILMAIETRTATGEGLDPDNTAIIHDMANVRPTDPPASDTPS